MDDSLDVFAYGSLMSEPAAPTHIIGRHRAVLPGWRRVFHQRSHTRGCPADAAPDEPAVPGFVDPDGVRFSLALGLVEDPESRVVGVCLHYDAAFGEAVLDELSRREGPGYQQVALQVQTELGVRRVWSWVSRTGHPRVVDLPLVEQARVLRAGTPIRDIDGRARGVRYLDDVVEALAGMGERDRALDELQATVGR